jgi:SulP family sulfate permease
MKIALKSCQTSVSDLVPNLFAGLVLGLVTVTSCVSYAAFIFSHDLTCYLPLGIMSALIGTALIGFIVALGSSFPSALAGPGANSAAILALMASSIAGSMALRPATFILSTVFTAIVLTSLCTGALLFALGHFRLGGLIRFIPYPVVGGFLAGTGWLIVKGGFTVMMGSSLTLYQLPILLKRNPLLHWLPGFLFAIILLVVKRRSAHYLYMPVFLLIGITLSHVLLLLNDIPLSQAVDKGWLFTPFPKTELWQHLGSFSFAFIDWFVLLKQSGSLMAMMAVVAITILLNATGIELATQNDVDLNQELRVDGLANLIAGIFGGMVGYLMVGRSLLNQKAGANSGLAGIVVAVLCVGILFWGAPILAYLPRPIIGGLLLYLGLTLLTEWIYDAWFKLSRTDYALVLVILLIVATRGFLVGVGVGIVIACILFVLSYSHIHAIKYTATGAEQRSNVERPVRYLKQLKEKGREIYVLCLQGFLFFGTAHTVLDHVRHILGNPGSQVSHFLLIDFRLVTGLDSSAVLSLARIKQLGQVNNVILVLTNLKPEFQHRLQQSGFIEQKDTYCHTFPDLDRGLEWCENQILEGEKTTTMYPASLPKQLIEQFHDQEHITHLMEYLEELEVPAGSILFRKGDPSETLYFVESGQVSAILELPDGHKKRLRTMGAGTVFGEMGFYRGVPRSASVVADLPSRLYCLTKASLKKMEKEDPQLAAAFQQFIIRLLADRLDQTTSERRILLQ